MNKDILNLFEKYNLSFKKLKDLLQDELIKSLQLFNLRL